MNKWPHPPGSSSGLTLRSSSTLLLQWDSALVAHSGTWLDFVPLIGCLPFPVLLLHAPSHCFSLTLKTLLWLRVSAYGGTQSKMRVLPTEPDHEDRGWRQERSKSGSQNPTLGKNT